MPAQTPAEICTLFRQAMAAGDVDAVLALYDPEAVFAGTAQEATSGREALRDALKAQAEAHTRFDFDIRRVITAGDIALMHTEWTVGEERAKTYAIEVARRQADGSWKWLIGDPFTVDREHS